MNKFLSFIVLAVATLLAACSDDAMLNPGSDISVPDGTPIEISSAIEIPEMYFGDGHNSRLLQENISSSYLKNTLKIHILVFDKSGAMRQYIEPENIEITSTTETIAKFKVKNIYASKERRTLHFVILPDITDLRTIKGGEFIDMMANETVVMPALQVSNETDAYWGRVNVPNINADMTVELKAIRNFAKIMVSDLTGRDDFEITAYAVVNQPALSLIAPYKTKDYLFADFFDAAGEPQSYENVTQTQGFIGINPSDIDNNLSCTTVEEVKAAIDISEKAITNNTSSDYNTKLTSAPCYIYERTQSNIDRASSSVNVTYLIVRATVNGNTENYYKIDIGTETNGIFRYYDIIRNFKYNIQIKMVTGNGAPTLAEAMNGAASNNMSTSVVIRDLFSIGYGNHKIEVNNTRAFITRNNSTYHFRFRYTVDDNEQPFDASNLCIYDVANENDETKWHNMGSVTDNNAVSLPNLASSGDKNLVIKNATVTKEATGWYDVAIETYDVPNSAVDRYEQTLKVLYKGGLSRNFTIMLRQPWEFNNVTTTTENLNKTVDNTIPITFTLPDGLSKTQFPIIVTFESDKQNIYAVPGEDLTVGYVKSGFNGATTDNVISYERRIEYEEYAATKTYTVNFKTNTTSAEDKGYNTSSIDNIGIDGRTRNNDGPNFCIRMGDRNPDGMRYFNPKYINYTRNE